MRAPKPEVGRKFHADGTVRRFPGNTIICPVGPDAPQYDEICAVQTRALARRFGPKLAPLPPSSFHVTVFDGLCDEERVPEHWSSRIPLDAPLEETDRLLSEWLAPLRGPERLNMELAGLGSFEVGLNLELRPADEVSAAGLADFREAVARATGIRHPGFERYAFHLSLAYLLYELDGEELADYRELAAETEARLAQSFGVLELGRPQLTFFEDMFAFLLSRG